MPEFVKKFTDSAISPGRAFSVSAIGARKFFRVLNQ
jgi:hypothetical protein